MSEMRKRIRQIVGLLASFRDPQDHIDEATDDIATLFEEERQAHNEWAEAVKVAGVNYEKRLAQSTAQVAEMQEAIKDLSEDFALWEEGVEVGGELVTPLLDDWIPDHVMRLRLLASSAPKVLYSATGHIFHQLDMPEYDLNPYTVLDIEGDELPLGDGHKGMDGQSVRMLVYEREQEQVRTEESSPE